MSTALLSAAVVAACSSSPATGIADPGVDGGDAPPDGVPETPDATRADGGSGGASGYDGGSTPTGLAPEPKWSDGTKCSASAPIETWALDASTFVLRQPLCTHFEAPFMVLLAGDDRAMLVDTGTGHVDVGAAVDAVLGGRNVELLVVHSHAHGDHVGGDAKLAQRRSTRVVRRSVAAVKAEFGFDDTGAARSVDLGGRIVDVLPTPGHEASHVAFYDRKTAVLLTGDTLYPGRLYVRDFAAFKASIARLVGFVDAKHPVSLVLGAHVELDETGGELTAGAKTHPNEHALSLAESDLRDLHAMLQKMSAPARVVGPRWVIVPVQ